MPLPRPVEVATGHEPFLVMRDLVKRYPGVLALDHFGGAIRAGVVLGLLGKNGAGKSTVIKVLAGALKPDSGEILIDGEPIAIHGPHHATQLGIAVVHQELADVPNLSVAENVELGLGYPRKAGIFVDRKGLRRKTRDTLEMLGAGLDPDALVSSLSIAQRRLVMLARGLAANARLLILDEPTASLPDAEIDHLHGIVRLLQERDVSVVYVTHRLDEIFEITDHVAVMRDGRVVYSGRTEELTKQRVDRAHHGECRGRARAPRAPRHLADRGRRGAAARRGPDPARHRRGRQLQPPQRASSLGLPGSSAPAAASWSG